jgi:arylsulfatase
LVVLDGRPAFLLNVTSTPFAVRATEILPSGRHRVGFRLAGKNGLVLVDGTVVAEEPLPLGLGASGLQIGGGGLRIGYDHGFPVNDDYAPPYPWTGDLHAVTFTDARAAATDEASVTALLRRE